jgi:FkbM family methyltransferase
MNRLSSPVRSGIDPYQRLATLLGPDVSMIVDGGANKGRMTARLLQLFPKAHVFAFEPIPRLARKLSKRFDEEPRVTIHSVALGSRTTTLTLNVLESATCSSLLEPSGIRNKHPDKPMGIAQTVSVPVVRLEDELLSSPDIIKLDLQGFELEALKGAQALLPGVRAVLCEVSFSDLYVGQPQEDEVTEWMLARDFSIDGLYNPWFNESGAIISADALFVHA